LLGKEDVRAISRRYFVSNGFDGTLTCIGVVVGASLVPGFVELPVVLALVGVDRPIGVSLGFGVVTFVLVLLRSEMTGRNGASAGSRAAPVVDGSSRQPTAARRSRTERVI
jgi:hypothetical protein